MTKAADDGIARLNFQYSYDANDVGLVLLVALGLAVLTLSYLATARQLVSAVILVGIGVTLARKRISAVH